MIYVFDLIINVNIAQPPTEYHVILKRYKKITFGGGGALIFTDLGTCSLFSIGWFVVDMRATYRRMSE